MTASLTVCPSGCDFTSIQTAISAASPGDTIRILSVLPHTENDITVNKGIHFEGLGMTLTTVQGAVSASGTPNVVFNIVTGGTVTFKDITIRHGGTTSGDFAGGIINNGGLVTLERVRVHHNDGVNAGGIHNEGSMTIHHSRIENNSSFGSGGGIRNENIMVVNNTQVTGNHSSFSGGGIANLGNLIVRNSTISGNTGTNFGGGIIASGGTTDISGSTIDSNTSNDSGAGIYACWPEIRLTNTTISENVTPGNGGGIFVCNNGNVSLANVTISENTADSDDSSGGHGGGIYISTPGTVHMKNTIVAGNYDLSSFIFSKAPDCHGSVDSDGYNLIGSLGTALNGTYCTVSGVSTGNHIGVSAELGVLQDNGGPTMTHALLPVSPAIDAGNPAGCTDYNSDMITVDQRGGDRHDRCDIGAFELGALTHHVFLAIIRKH
jgi:hypothetical protein